MSAAADADFRGAQRRLEGLFFGVSLLQAEIEHGAQRSGAVGREGSGVEADFTDEVGVDDAHRTARGTQRGEVVDVGNLDAVHEEPVLRRSSAPHDEVVSVAYGREGDARIGAYDARDVAVRTGALLDFAHADDLHAHGTFGRTAEYGGGDRHRLDRSGVLFQFDEDRFHGRRYEVFGRKEAFVTQRRDREAADARLHPVDDEAARRVRRGAFFGMTVNDDGCIGYRLAREAVDDPSPHRVAFDGSRERQCRQQQKQCKRQPSYHSIICGRTALAKRRSRRRFAARKNFSGKRWTRIRRRKGRMHSARGRDGMKMSVVVILYFRAMKKRSKQSSAAGAIR